MKTGGKQQPASLNGNIGREDSAMRRRVMRGERGTPAAGQQMKNTDSMSNSVIESIQGVAG